MPFIIVQNIGIITFSVGSKKFQLVSATNQLAALFSQFAFEVFPIVSVFGIIILIIEHTNDIRNREPPLVEFVIPDGSYLAVVIKTY